MRKFTVKNNMLKVACEVSACNRSHARIAAMRRCNDKSKYNDIDFWETCYNEDVPPSFTFYKRPNHQQ